MVSTIRFWMFVVATVGLLLGQVHAHDARVEIHPMQSTTMKTQDFLTGTKEGKPATIAGELRLPASSRDRLPAVVLLHGSRGISDNVMEWAEFLNAMGVATFVPDTFTGRGAVSLAEDQSQLSRFMSIIDAYRALALLEKHSRIDPNRIALMGFSRGGRAALYASLKRFQKMHGPNGSQGFAAYIAFYPDCGVRHINDDDVVDKPIRIFHGSADDWNPVAPCREYADRLRKNNKDAHISEYADAHHVFDRTTLTVPLKLPRAQTARNCQLEEAADGKIINSRTKQPFGLNDPCVERGVTISYNARATAEARKAVQELVLQVLKP
jgi:dienelactone hydrolase